ncbi:putative replication factor-A subunit [Triangularia verruculosa]|uniref:Replication factor-A subunit n=1 Tax=Triangularia verruculosa TaxID=2587418 RepID=A0AAN6XKY6_9PEZI|nr:putative replication factor-A subunit [Triangularia verruculosa]
MASYGGYQRTGYGAQGGDEGGGFMSGSQQGSQGQSKRSTIDEYLRPVTIKQILDAKAGYSESEIAVDGFAVSTVTLVGQVRSVNPQTTNITYKIDDGTGGTIDVKKWVDLEKSESGAETPFSLDTWVRVLGRLTSFNGKIHVGAHHVRVIDDYNEVSYHLLEATYVHLCISRGLPGGPWPHKEGAVGGGGHGGGDSDSMFIDGGNGYGTASGAGGDSRVASCSRQAKSLYQFMQSDPRSIEGINIADVMGASGMSKRDILAAADELLGNGIVYTTVDDETWAILET